ncbi:hypothetical protein NQ315_000696 [Exocentrus adspersus]|uniref:Phosphatidylinositol-specific phospholipase C X domain-containing protein n=1 Tax=Exocentrus adspersus TaxID=1586481 RepID=A0AAV8WD98_9CUCU|nr:hypothetical protein NQ315_000696 [Exocentrus adspersus]
MVKKFNWKFSIFKKFRPPLRLREKGEIEGDIQDENFEYWMTNLADDVKSVPIIYLTIPGSHDSFTASISTGSEISPDADEILQNLKFLGPIITYFMANWSRTQEYHATEQLVSGVRYFDLRVATKEGTDDFYFVHGLYSDNVKEVLVSITEFLNSHPQEAVILDFQHFYAFTDSDHERLMEILSKTFEAKMVPYTDSMDIVTLKYMAAHQYQVITIYRSDAARFGQPLLWPSSTFPTPWPDTVSTDDLFAALDEGIKTRSSAVGFVSQCVLTPSLAFILKNPFSTLKKTCAEDLEAQRLEWINNQSAGKGGMNIVIADYVNLSNCDFIKAVINLNERLVQMGDNNSKLQDVIIDIEKHI